MPLYLLVPSTSFFRMEIGSEKEIPVPGMDVLTLAPVLELTLIPPHFPPILIPTLFFPMLSFTPGAILMLFLKRIPIFFSFPCPSWTFFYFYLRSLRKLCYNDSTVGGNTLKGAVDHGWKKV